MHDDSSGFLCARCGRSEPAHFLPSGAWRCPGCGSSYSVTRKPTYEAAWHSAARTVADLVAPNHIEVQQTLNRYGRAYEELHRTLRDLDGRETRVDILLPIAHRMYEAAYHRMKTFLSRPTIQRLTASIRDDIRTDATGWSLRRMLAEGMESEFPGEGVDTNGSALNRSRQLYLQLQWLRHKHEHGADADWPGSPAPVHSDRGLNPRDVVTPEAHLTVPYLRQLFDAVLELWPITMRLDPNGDMAETRLWVDQLRL